MIEVAVVLDDAHRPLFWHEPPGARATALPDSRTLWEVLWTERHRLGGVAHLHPGRGEPVPSREDLTTFAACEAGLGQRLGWWIATADQVRCFVWAGPDRLGYAGRDPGFPLRMGRSGPVGEAEIEAWVAELRRRGHAATRGRNR